MSHFALGVVLPDDLPAEDTEHYIERVLQPYNVELKTAPRKEYFSQDELVAMTAHYADTNDANFTKASDLLPFITDWSGGEGGLDNDGLYHITTKNPNSKLEWYKIGGRYAKRLNGKNQVLLASLESPESVFHAFVTPQGDWAEEGSMGWFGVLSDRVAPAEWSKRIKALKEAYGHCEIVMIDCHN